MPAVPLHGRRPDISSSGSQRPQPTCQPLMSVSLMFQGQLKKSHSYCFTAIGRHTGQMFGLYF